CVSEHPRGTQVWVVTSQRSPTKQSSDEAHPGRQVKVSRSQVDSISQSLLERQSTSRHCWSTQAWLAPQAVVDVQAGPAGAHEAEHRAKRRTLPLRAITR